jgi:hypothetical protein
MPLILCVLISSFQLIATQPTLALEHHDRCEAIHDPVNIPPTQMPIPDEDPGEEVIVTDLDVAAEVTLGSKPSLSYFTLFLLFF